MLVLHVGKHVWLDIMFLAIRASCFHGIIGVLLRYYQRKTTERARPSVRPFFNFFNIMKSSSGALDGFSTPDWGGIVKAKSKISFQKGELR